MERAMIYLRQSPRDDWIPFETDDLIEALRQYWKGWFQDGYDFDGERLYVSKDKRSWELIDVKVKYHPEISTEIARVCYNCDLWVKHRNCGVDGKRTEALDDYGCTEFRKKS